MASKIEFRNEKADLWFDRGFIITIGTDEVHISPKLAEAFRDFFNQVEAIQKVPEAKGSMVRMVYEPDNYRNKIEYSIKTTPIEDEEKQTGQEMVGTRKA